MIFNKEKLDKSRNEYFRFINSMKLNHDQYSFTSGASQSPYALCFAIFGLNLINKKEDLIEKSDLIAKTLVNNVRIKRKERISKGINIVYDKEYLQLLSFTLSSLSIINKLNFDNLENEVSEVIPKDIKKALFLKGVFDCKGGSGNYAMFLAIFLIYSRDYLNKQCQNKIDQWLDLHVQNMNTNYLWGKFKYITHHQFQNGYHQYEIFEYLRINYNNDFINGLSIIKSIIDKNGNFAPWPGGASCHDYDAYYLLTLKPNYPLSEQKFFMPIINSIISNQNNDGGFCETKLIRPRSLNNLLLFLNHLFVTNPLVFKERLYQLVTLQRNKHNKIHSYVSDLSREWYQSNLWDSWFRMMTLARIQCKLDTNSRTNWGFIDFPGIGFFRE